MDNPCKESFDKWWHNEGSAIAPKPGEDREIHMKRVSEIAWSNGAYSAIDYVEKAVKAATKKE